MNGRRKGQVGEREWCKVLEAAGFGEASRNDQTRGGYDNPDIFCDALDHLHFEVKRTERFNCYDAIEQARRDCCNRTPVVAHRRNRGEWLVVLRASDFLKMLRHRQAPGRSAPESPCRRMLPASDQRRQYEVPLPNNRRSDHE